MERCCYFCLKLFYLIIYCLCFILHLNQSLAFTWAHFYRFHDIKQSSKYIFMLASLDIFSDVLPWKVSQSRLRNCPRFTNRTKLHPACNSRERAFLGLWSLNTSSPWRTCFRRKTNCRWQALCHFSGAQHIIRLVRLSWGSLCGPAQRASGAVPNGAKALPWCQ